MGARRLAAVAAVLAAAGAAASALLPGGGVTAPAVAPPPRAVPAAVLPPAWPAQAVSLPAVAVPAVAVPMAIAAPPSRSIARVDFKLSLDWPDADRREAIERLAAITGSRVHGLEQLPHTLGRATLSANGIDAAAAWHLLLDGAPLGFALTCDARACAVWLAAADAPAAVAQAAVAVPVQPRAESTEEGN